MQEHPFVDPLLVTSVAVATASQFAADAAYEVAAAGGNAVDCALAAGLLAMNTEPGVCALAGGSFITIWQHGGAPVTIDGNVAVPGAGLAAAERGQGATAVTMDYGGGIATLGGAPPPRRPGPARPFAAAATTTSAIPATAFLRAATMVSAPCITRTAHCVTPAVGSSFPTSPTPWTRYRAKAPACSMQANSRRFCRITAATAAAC